MRSRFRVLVLSAGLVAVACGADDTSTAPNSTIAAPEIAGVEVFDDLGSEHVDAPTFDDLPPAGGDHSDVWANCGIYTSELPLGNVVHTLEHGVVWLTYGADVSTDEIIILADAADQHADRTIVAPIESLGDELWAVAWGRRVQLDSAADPRLELFMAAFINGAQSPEPGAPCDGGLG
jgi:hypothetical protein